MNRTGIPPFDVISNMGLKSFCSNGDWYSVHYEAAAASCRSTSHGADLNIC